MIEWLYLFAIFIGVSFLLCFGIVLRVYLDVRKEHKTFEKNKRATEQRLRNMGLKGNNK